MSGMEYTVLPEVVPGSGLARMRGKRGFLTAEITKEAPGKVKLDRREWPVLEMGGTPMKAGTRVEVVDARPDGTLVVKRANPGG